MGLNSRFYALGRGSYIKLISLAKNAKTARESKKCFQALISFLSDLGDLCERMFFITRYFC